MLTCPNTTCFMSSQGVLARVRKNLHAPPVMSYVRKQSSHLFPGHAVQLCITDHLMQSTCPCPMISALSQWKRAYWEPFVLGPALAMDRTPGPMCISSKFSSSNFAP